MSFETMLESEVNATLMMIEKEGSKALVFAVVASGTKEPDAEAEGVLCRAVSTTVKRRDAEVFCHALRREADRIERLIGGLETEMRPA